MANSTCVESDTTSVSKGCFVFKSKKRKPPLDPGDYYIPEDKAETSQDCKLRYTSCDRQWELINEDIETLQEEVNRTLFRDLLSFIQNAQKGFSLDQDLGAKSRPGSKEIPTAAFVTGVNVTDHHDIFMKLTSVFQEKVSPHVVSLTSKDCATLKSLMGTVVSQLMGIEYIVSEDENTHQEVNVKKIPCTFPVLTEWYKDTSKKRKSSGVTSTLKSPRRSRKRRSTTGPVSYPDFPPIIIVLEDLEGFKPVVIQDFIHIASQYLERLPLVLTFGIATTVAVIHRLLPQSVSSCLSIEKFQAQPSSVYLAQVIDTVLLTAKHPFRLGSKVFQLLLDLFLYHDFSVMNFVQGLQFAVLDHYYSQPMSILCCRYGDAINRVRNLSHDQLELFRQSASFRRYVDGCPPADQRALLLDDKHMKKVLQELLKRLTDYHKAFFPVLQCLHILSCDLPYHPLGKQTRELYAVASDSNIFETEGYEEAFKFMKMFARNEFLQKLDACEEVLASWEGLGEARFTVETLQAKMDTMADACPQSMDPETPEADGKEGEQSVNGSSEGGAARGEKMTLHDLQRQLMSGNKKQRKLTRYEALRNETLEFFDSLFREYLVCPRHMPLHEVFYYSNVSEIRQRLNASPRAAIQSALSNPNYYLQNPDCEMLEEGITSSLPDVCIVYKLHLECGRLINLYDWLQAFITVIQGSSETDQSEPSKKPDPVLQARFIRAVSELQFLGFIKPTRRKTDHVARLTWGGC